MPANTGYLVLLIEPEAQICQAGRGLKIRPDSVPPVVLQAAACAVC